jgi:hypothetical protein
MRGRMISPGVRFVLAVGLALVLSTKAGSSASGRIALAAVAQQREPSREAIAAGALRMRIVRRNLIASGRAPPYDVLVSLDGATTPADAAPIRLGSLDLFGGAGHGVRHEPSARPGVESATFEATDALARLARAPGFALRLLRVSIVRRGFPGVAGAEFVPPDPDPPRIGAIELLQS